MDRKSIGFYIYVLGFVFAFLAYQLEPYFQSIGNEDFWFYMISLSFVCYLSDSLINETKPTRKIIRFLIWMSALIACFYEFLGLGTVYSILKLSTFSVMLIYTIYFLMNKK